MEGITKPAITRLARRAGVKSVSDDSFDLVRNNVEDLITEIVANAMVVNSERKTKTLMVDDVYSALSMMNYNVARTSDLGTSTCAK